MKPLLEMCTNDSLTELELFYEIDTNDLRRSHVVYQDVKYDFKLKNISNISNIEMIVNNENVDIVWKKEAEDQYFIEVSRNSSLFLLTYGMTEIIVHVEFFDGDEQYLFTEPLSVAVRKEYEKSIESLYEMLNVIYHKDDMLLYQSKPDNRRRQIDIYNKADNRLEVEIDELRLILQTLQKNFPYFLKNSCQLTETKYCVDSLEKIRSLEAKNIQYIVTHPEELNETYNSNGIYINNNRFIPRKTLVGVSEYTRNTYENRIIVSFIWTVLTHIKIRKEEITNLLKKNEIDVHTKAEAKKDYVLCTKIIQQYIKITYTRYEEKFIEFQKQFSAIYSQYCLALVKETTILNKVPEPTPTFLEIYHYRNVFQLINQWFGNSKFRVPQNNILLQFSNADRIYEYYCLLGLYGSLLELGFEEIYERREAYKYKVNYTKFENTEQANTFYFKKDRMYVTLYYQPVIYSDQTSTTNSIDLFRTDRFFYTPDFILKRVVGNKTTYAIIDAKWRNRNTLLDKKKEGGMQDLVYKYLYSVVNATTKQSVDFLWLLQGKDDNRDMKMWIQRNGTKSRQQNESFRMASGIVRYTPKSGGEELTKIMNIFLNG